MLESLFNKDAFMKVCNFIEKRFQHQCFPVNFAKFLGTPFFQNICQRLLLSDFRKAFSVQARIQNNQVAKTPQNVNMFGFSEHGDTAPPKKVKTLQILISTISTNIQQCGYLTILSASQMFFDVFYHVTIRVDKIKNVCF